MGNRTSCAPAPKPLELEPSSRKETKQPAHRAWGHSSNRLNKEGNLTIPQLDADEMSVFPSIPTITLMDGRTEAHTEKLQDEETLDSLLVGEEAKLELLLLVEQADAQQVVPELSAEPSLVLGDGTQGDGDTQLHYPTGAAFIGAHPDWLVTTEQDGHRIKISNIRTGALVCKFSDLPDEFGEYGKEVRP